MRIWLSEPYAMWQCELYYKCSDCDTRGNLNVMFYLTTFSLFGYVKILFGSLHVFERIDPLDLTQWF